MFIPAGTYTIRGTLNVPSNVVLRGSNEYPFRSWGLPEGPPPLAPPCWLTQARATKHLHPLSCCTPTAECEASMCSTPPRIEIVGLRQEKRENRLLKWLEGRLVGGRTCSRAHVLARLAGVGV